MGAQDTFLPKSPSSGVFSGALLFMSGKAPAPGCAPGGPGEGGVLSVQ